MAEISPPDLAALADQVEAALEDAARAAGSFADDPSGWHARHHAEMAALVQRLQAELGARVVDRWDVARVTLAGITSTSTSGIAAALRNWLARARQQDSANG